MLLYLNPETAAWTQRDGCLRLLRGSGDLEDYAVEVPPVNGTLLVFPNGPTTWHGHRQYIGKRYAVMGAQLPETITWQRTITRISCTHTIRAHTRMYC